VWSNATGSAKDDFKELDRDIGGWCGMEVIVDPAEGGTKILGLFNALFHNWLRECVIRAECTGRLQSAVIEIIVIISPQRLLKRPTTMEMNDDDDG
jgi:hypothetical protein